MNYERDDLLLVIAIVFVAPHIHYDVGVSVSALALGIYAVRRIFNGTR